MAYKVVVEPEAQQDIDDALDYYNRLTDDVNVLINLLDDIEQAFLALKINPFLNPQQTLQGFALKKVSLPHVF